MSAPTRSILLLGEAGVGKTHYGAQLLKRLITDGCNLRMDGAAKNLEPFEVAMESLNKGLATDHTPTSTYVESVWPVVDGSGRHAELIWPDYGGEQVSQISVRRRVPRAWQQRIKNSNAWLLMIRLQSTRLGEDIFSKPLKDLKPAAPDTSNSGVSDQARLVELLQMLLYTRGTILDYATLRPELLVLLSCWDELTEPSTPAEMFKKGLPFLSEFIDANWSPGAATVLGLSALMRPLNPGTPDPEYAAKGPEKFGYAVLADGSHSPDITLPISHIIRGYV